MSKSTGDKYKYILHKWNFMTMCKLLSYFNIIRTADMMHC